MSTQYVPLEVHPLNREAKIFPAHKLPELIYVTDPATYCMLDLQYAPLPIASLNDRIDAILQDVTISDLHAVLVLDEDRRLAGIISGRDVQGVKPAQISQAQRIRREEVTAKMLMVSCDAIIAVDYHALEKARIGNVVATLNSQKKRYILVVEKEENSGQEQIRGLIIAAKLSEQLGQDIKKIT